MGVIIQSGISGRYNLNFLRSGLTGNRSTVGHFRSGHRDSGGAGETPAVTTTYRLASGLLA